MIFSKPKHFHLSDAYLRKCRSEIIFYLDLKGIDAGYYIMAYDYFIENPTKYDGATIVKDLIDVHIDLTAMRHDYDYIVNLKKYKGFKWLKMKFKYDLDYGKNIEKMGKGHFGAYTRTFALWLTTPLYLLLK